MKVINRVKDFRWALSLANQCGGFVEEKYIEGETWFYIMVV